MTSPLSTQPITAWQLDPAHTMVEFSVKHMMFATVRGRFREVAGEIELDVSSPETAKLEVRIAAESVDTGVADRDTHLRSADFFAAEEHPHLTFVSRRIEGFPHVAGDRFRVIGDLTIRGVTREVELAAEYLGSGTNPWGQEVLGFTAKVSIDRRDYGLTWNQALEAGGILVGNEIRITLSVQANPAE